MAGKSQEQRKGKESSLFSTLGKEFQVYKESMREIKRERYSEV